MIDCGDQRFWIELGWVSKLAPRTSSHHRH